MLQNWNDLTLDSRNDLVFEGRNQNYGAFELRRNYNKRVSYIIGGMVLFSIALLGFKKLMDRPTTEDVVEKIQNVQIDLTPPPPIEDVPPPPPPPPPPPMVEMVKFTPPVIKDDAVETEPQKLQEDVKDVNVSTKDQEGEKDIVAPPTEIKGPAEVAAPEIFTVVEEMPEPPGGIAAFYKYVGQTVQYPSMAREAGISGKAHLKFVIEMDGSISDVQILKGVSGCSDCDKEAVRVIKSYPTKWKPGKQNGRAVRVFYNLPVSFKIN
ncbi:energy transducer TonB [Sediminibacterium sp.]|uniref:energy transducer TonB n=1 Tax=Sediminibacterium sp. TaxID=1917865 RepID=UPI002716677A|nr:energy transducer TonB [Sediminibacterium sp.]MDO9000480.1 energy transducer TonB [Bacteroidota bacterium]MDP3146952.1 energy transducer TonB [Bacteroidota bacterium]MDP3567510.1 energy transducer TonB [Sediminibacterium sp.]